MRRIPGRRFLERCYGHFHQSAFEQMSEPVSLLAPDAKLSSLRDQKLFAASFRFASGLVDLFLEAKRYRSSNSITLAHHILVVTAMIRITLYDDYPLCPLLRVIDLLPLRLGAETTLSGSVVIRNSFVSTHKTSFTTKVLPVGNKKGSRP